jgi:hypothetical protein
MYSTFLERSRRRVAASALLLTWSPIAGERAVAQALPEVETTPAEDAASSIPDPGFVTEPPGFTVPALEFDNSELELAGARVVRARNWFLLSGAAFAFGWILLGAGISGCETINDVEVCSRAADNTGEVGAAFVVFSGVPLLVTSIMFGVRSGQKKQLQLRTLQRLTNSGVSPPPASFDVYRLTDAKSRSRAARNGLFANTALFGFGWIFLGPAIPRCEARSGELVCTSPGYAYMTIGLTLTGAGTIGMIVSGILLGVRKRNERSLKRQTSRRPGARLHWDPYSGSFVF